MEVSNYATVLTEFEKKIWLLQNWLIVWWILFYLVLSMRKIIAEIEQTFLYYRYSMNIHILWHTYTIILYYENNTEAKLIISGLLCRNNTDTVGYSNVTGTGTIVVIQQHTDYCTTVPWLDMYSIIVYN